MPHVIETDVHRPDPEEILAARDCLQLLIIEYGDTHIDTLVQLLHLTSSVEVEFSHICAQRLG
jgi:hypothetical protein